MKTAIQELIQVTEDLMRVDHDYITLNDLIEVLKSRIELERDQIMDAFMEGNEHPYEHGYDAYKYYQNTYSHETPGTP